VVNREEKFTGREGEKEMSLPPFLLLSLFNFFVPQTGCGSRSQLVVESAPPEVDAAPEASPCTPTTCAAVGAVCGGIPDGCGGSLYCGVCPEMLCGGGGANQCGSYSCTPKTCADVGATCGIVSDGCSQVIHCGICPAGQACVGNMCSGG
jgi:hypothetical protein